jgi:hypothetical protein
VTMSAAANAVATFSDDDAGMGFYTMKSCRVLDTTAYRSGVFGGPALNVGQSRVVQVAGVCGIPSTARAVAVSVSVVKAMRGGNLRLYPADVPAPLVTALNYAVGQTRSNFAVVGLSASGALAIRTTQYSGTTDVMLDVTGYFE